MAVSRERFNQGMTYDEFKNWMPHNRDRIEGYENQVQLDPKEVAFFKDLRSQFLNGPYQSIPGVRLLRRQLHRDRPLDRSGAEPHQGIR
jgi:hypothetical protein